MAIESSYGIRDNHALSAETTKHFHDAWDDHDLHGRLMTLLLGFLGNFLIPCRSARAMSRSRALHAASFWMALTARTPASISARFVAGCPDAGWFGYANLTERYFSPETGTRNRLVGGRTLGSGKLRRFGRYQLLTRSSLRAPAVL